LPAADLTREAILFNPGAVTAHCLGIDAVAG
jgi:hypothetical protein